ncbi:MAG TPA: TetR/AcrR family transcriptional regulator C-terminal domain-containing protein [Trebonia sp.]|jgi:TetR/AcrR family tetracycline transcriptional repressor
MQLHREDVLAGALALLDAEGLEGLTMRKLAARLGVQAGALYWHFRHKQALLDAMADAVLAGADGPVPQGTWEQQLAELGARLRRALLARRDGARVVAGTFTVGPGTLRTGAMAVEILRSAGVPAEGAGWAGFALGYYVLGHCIEEQTQAELAGEGGWAAKVAGFTERDGSYFDLAMTAAITADPAERFAYGLGLFIDGIRARFAA